MSLPVKFVQEKFQGGGGGGGGGGGLSLKSHPKGQEKPRSKPMTLGLKGE